MYGIFRFSGDTPVPTASQFNHVFRISFVSASGVSGVDLPLKSCRAVAATLLATKSIHNFHAGKPKIGREAPSKFLFQNHGFLCHHSSEINILAHPCATNHIFPFAAKRQAFVNFCESNAKALLTLRIKSALRPTGLTTHTRTTVTTETNPCRLPADRHGCFVRRMYNLIPPLVHHAHSGDPAPDWPP